MGSSAVQDGVSRVVALLGEASAAVDASIDSLQRRWAPAPTRLLEAMTYSLQAGGKRLRPALVLETARACGHTDSPPGPAVQAAMFAVELVHTFSLVHDDLPAMDNDDLRRGRPTNHRIFGEAMAILAGDAMLAMAFEVLAADDIPPSVAARLVGELARSSGPTGMVGGQVLDIDAEHRSLELDQLRQMHAFKTGALLTGSCRMGAIAADAPRDALAAVTTYGQHVGLAFQIVDDLLDVTSTAQQMGKATGKDHGRGKNTYPGLLGIDGTRAAAESAVREAIRALDPLGASADGLRAIAEFVVRRDR